MRDNLEDPNQPGVYRWDFLDGYDGGEKHSLDHHPDLQEKVRRVVTQGFIDPEDWNGVSLLDELSWLFHMLLGNRSSIRSSVHPLNYYSIRLKEYRMLNFLLIIWTRTLK
jgi:hypothetical protein